MQTESPTIETVIVPREARIGASLTVKRVLPFRTRRLVGPFCFLDHMGPVGLSVGGDADVRPHPHIGLSTLTYLLEGQILHRDSLGNVQPIRPGDVNWMTAGQGIVHSERIPADFVAQSPVIHGLQAWVALPVGQEECAPSFVHYSAAQIPQFIQGGSRVSLIAGALSGHRSPVKTSSPLTYAKVEMSAGSEFEFQIAGQELGFYLLSGSVEIDGQSFASPTLVVFRLGASVRIVAKASTLGLVLGGEPLSERRLIYWNFVASRPELIESAKQRWRAQEFVKVPGETEFVPLPAANTDEH
jgi:redox-sensitive bicupin YhaK (pirin superfamily)